MMRLAPLCLVALFALACTSAPGQTVAQSVPAATPSPTPPLGMNELSGAEFTKNGGCGDVFIWATRADGSAAITVEWRGAASKAWANEAFHETQQLPNAEISVSVVEGSGLTSYFCNDIRMPGQGVT